MRKYEHLQQAPKAECTRRECDPSSQNWLNLVANRMGHGVFSLTGMLSAKPQFAEVLYLEGGHSLHQTPEKYLGAWRSVNDLQGQLGPVLFRKSLDLTEKRLTGVTAVETTYMTRAWPARRA